LSDSEESVEPESFVPILEAIRDVFLEHDFIAQATEVADLVDLAHLGSPDFSKRLGGGMMWGSSGSVADSVGLRRSLAPIDAETEQDGIELMRLLIQLAEQMKEQGISSQGSEFVANAFRRGLEKLRTREREQ
jgi:hypothetical protein